MSFFLFKHPTSFSYEGIFFFNKENVINDYNSHHSYNRILELALGKLERKLQNQGLDPKGC